MVWKKLNNIYIISDEGLIKNTLTNHIIIPWLNDGGYCCVTLNLEGKRKNYRIHRLVAQCFIPNPNNLPQVNHIDGDKQNNRVDNLEWCDSSYNLRHAVALGLISTGVKHKASKLSQENVDYIRTHYIKGDRKYGCMALGRKFNVDKKVIYNVVNNKRYNEDSLGQWGGGGTLSQV